MPYVAIQNGDRVGPWEVEDGTDVDCPLCDDAMRPRCGEGTKRERHFWHYKGTECSGESDQHRRMKAVAAAQARECWPDAEVGIEVETGGIDTVRVADVLVTFKEFHDTLGAGLAIECQYRNEQKDYTQVSWDHAQANYSTVWLESKHFDGRDVNIGAGDWREWRKYWCLPPERSKNVWDEYPTPPQERESADQIKRQEGPLPVGKDWEYRWNDLFHRPPGIDLDEWLVVGCPECPNDYYVSLDEVHDALGPTHLCERCGWTGEVEELEISFDKATVDPVSGRLHIR